MERLHARYPFLEAARDAVEAADIDLAALVVEGGPAVERGRERVERALLEGTTEPTARTPTVRTELLSYPVARVLVSLLDVPGAVEKYAAAEAATARERFERDFADDIRLKSRSGQQLTLDGLLADFELSGRIEPVGDGQFDASVTAYLELTAGLNGEEWRLAARPLAAGRVPIHRRELYTLLREAVDRRVRDGLPLEVPDAIGDELQAELDVLRSAISELDPPTSFDAVVPGQFPPCMRALLERARSNEPLETHSRFSLVAFLSCVGLGADEIVELCSLSEEPAESVRAQVELLSDDGDGVATPPSCATMDAYGDCVDKDELCEAIPHPLSYYGKALARTPDDRLADWRG